MIEARFRPSLAEVKAALRVDFASDDGMLEQYLDAADRLVSEAVGRVQPGLDYPNLKTAIIMTVAHWYDAPRDTPQAATVPPMAMTLIDLSRTGWVKS